MIAPEVESAPMVSFRFDSPDTWTDRMRSWDV
jgi:hypothetical protein